MNCVFHVPKGAWPEMYDLMGYWHSTLSQPRSDQYSWTLGSPPQKFFQLFIIALTQIWDRVVCYWQAESGRRFMTMCGLSDTSENGT